MTPEQRQQIYDEEGVRLEARIEIQEREKNQEQERQRQAAALRVSVSRQRAPFYIASNMRILQFVFLFALPLFAQPTPIQATGTWKFRARIPASDGAPDPEKSATLHIQQGSDNRLSGEFLYDNSPRPIPLTGSVTTNFNGCCSISLGHAGENGGTYTYFGSLSSNSMGGQYEVISRGSLVRLNWIATRVAGFGPPQILEVTNAASGRRGSVVPGQLISIFANASTNPIGPQNPLGSQLDATGKVATNLGGVRVKLLPTGVYAPLLYVSASQINAVVPYEIAGLSEVQVQVEYAGALSNAFRSPVDSVGPGIFAINGVGQGAILNQDGRPNGTTNPAARGEVVVLFITGAGQTSPPGVTGKITVPLETVPVTPRPLATVDVRMNGEPAAVLFCGEAPGLVSGVVQVNVRIPSTVSPGNLPVQVFFSGLGSQVGVTLAVK